MKPTPALWAQPRVITSVSTFARHVHSAQRALGVDATEHATVRTLWSQVDPLPGMQATTWADLRTFQSLQHCSGHVNEKHLCANVILQLDIYSR